MKNKYYLLLFAAASILCSCKKDNNSPTSNGSFLVKTYTEDIQSTVIGNSLITYDLSYDSKNRLTNLTSTPAPPALNFIYQFPSAGLFTVDLYSQGNLSIHEIGWLNPNSKLDSTYQFNDTGDSTTEKYIYNASHQLIQQKDYNYYTTGAILSYTTNFTYDNLGNVIESADDQGKIIDYIYYTGIPNTLNMGQAYLPQAVNLVKTSTLNSGGTIETTSHYYTFDSNNRLVKDSSSTIELNLIVIRSYTY